jgi:hypothetical protein
MRLFTRRNSAIAGIALAVGLLIGTAGAGLAGSGTPANKVTAAASTEVVLGPGDSLPILTATMRTSKPTDLILQLTMECSIFTRLVTGPSDNGATDTASATGTVQAWIEIDGVVVPVTSVSSPPQNPPPGGNKVTDGATMCHRTYQRSVTDAENPLDGQDIEDDYIDTKSAHGFNWLRQNAGSGVHEIVVYATLTESTTGDATAQAEIRNRTLIVEPTKMANDAVIG